MRYLLAMMLSVLVVASAHAVPISWVDWTSGTAGASGSATGSLNIDGELVTVNYTGEIQFIQTSGGTNYWVPDAYSTTNSVVDNPPPTPDIIALSRATQKTLTFSRPIANPLFAVVSLNGNGYSFDQDFNILGYGRGYWGTGTLTKTNPSPGIYQLNGSGEPHGVIQFTGAFTSVSWTSLSNENWNGFTIGVTGLAEPYLGTSPDDTGTVSFLARVDESDSQTVNVANAGAVESTLTGQVTGPAGSPFSGPTEAPGFSLAGATSTDFTYTFAPATRGTFNDSIEAQSNEDGTHTIGLQGVGVGPVVSSSITPDTTIDLGTAVSPNTLDTTLTIGNITPDDNGGDAGLTDLTLDFSIIGADASLFEVDLVGGETVGKAGDLDILVTFRGDLAPGDGTYNATLVLLTDENAALGDTVNGESYSFDLTATVVPEPASLALVGVGGFLLARRRR